MKVWERINQINGTDAGRQTIVKWMVRNRICPLLIEEALEKEDRALHELADKHCQEFGECSGACYVAFLDREVDR